MRQEARPRGSQGRKRGDDGPRDTPPDSIGRSAGSTFGAPPSLPVSPLRYVASLACPSQPPAVSRPRGGHKKSDARSDGEALPPLRYVRTAQNLCVCACACVGGGNARAVANRQGPRTPEDE